MSQIRPRKEAVVDRNQRIVFAHLMANPCVDCGETDVLVLEFDHLRDKDEAIARLIRNAEPWRLIAEIAKCEVVCANCHRRRTAARTSNWYRVRLLDESRNR